MPGCFFQPSISPRLSGRSSGNFPRIASLPGCSRAASIASAFELGSHPGGWRIAASTPASSISFNRLSALKPDICRWVGWVGGPLLQMWTCASTITGLLPAFESCPIPAGQRRTSFVGAAEEVQDLLLGVGGQSDFLVGKNEL